VTGRQAWAARAVGIGAAGALLVFAPLGTASLERYHLAKELWLECWIAIALAIAPGAPRRLAFASLPLAISTALSAALAIDAWIGLRLGALTFAGIGAAWILHGASPRRRIEVLAMVTAALALVAALVLAETFGLAHELSGVGRAPGATLGQRNAAAHVLALGLVPAVFAAVAPGSRRRRALAIAATLLFAAAIVATRCRAAWLAAIVLAAIAAGLAVRDAIGRRRSALRAVLVAAAAALAVAAIVSVRSSLRWRTPEPYRATWEHLLDAESGSGAGRLVQYEASLALVADAPLLGHGPGNWMVVYPRVSPADDPTFLRHGWAHTGRLLVSDAISLPVERGVLGVAGVLVFAFALARLGGRARPAGIAGVAVAAVLGSLDTVAQLAASLGVLAVILVPREKERDVRVRTPAVALALVLAAGCVHRGIELRALALRAEETATEGSLAEAVRLDPGDYDSRATLVDILLRRGDCARALPVLDEMVALRPEHHRPRLEAANCRGTP
jgi:O-antigen ligase